MLLKLLIILPYFTLFVQRLLGNKATLKLIFYITGGEKFYYTKVKFDNILNRKILQLYILLPGKGCEWAKNTGGCTMCGLYQKANKFGNKITQNGLIALYKTAGILTRTLNPETINIYNGGSFLNVNEINEKTQFKIFKLVSKHTTVKKLFIESRPEFIIEGVIKKITNILDDKILEIGIGLESFNEKIRNVNINKGINIESYNSAIKILKKYKSKSLTYVLIKPIGVSENEAINEAISTTKYVFEVGCDEVAYEAAFIQPNTKMEVLYMSNLYKTPWLWSIIKIINECYKYGKISIGEFEDEPKPIATPYNCDYCSDKIFTILNLFRETNNIKLFKNLPECSCQNDWLKVIESNQF